MTSPSSWCTYLNSYVSRQYHFNSMVGGYFNFYGNTYVLFVIKKNHPSTRYSAFSIGSSVLRLEAKKVFKMKIYIYYVDIFYF